MDGVEEADEVEGIVTAVDHSSKIEEQKKIDRLRVASPLQRCFIFIRLRTTRLFSREDPTNRNNTALKDPILPFLGRACAW